ncbi:MAG: hypothetical protein IKI41_00045, partial [Clostridia bacterium]|nr:hypothetical protein [Clostridia bacterium]
PTSRLIEFIRNFYVTEQSNGEYINNCTKSETHTQIKESLGMAKLGQLPEKKRLGINTQCVDLTPQMRVIS